MVAGLYIRTKEHREKMSEIMKNSSKHKENHPWLGKHLSKEHKMAISKTLTGTKLSEERRKNIGKGGLIRWAKISKEGRIILTRKWAKAGAKAAIGNKNCLGREMSKEARKKISKANKISQKERWAKFSKEERIRMSKNLILSNGTIASQKANPSSIEKAIWKVLDGLNIGYETQVPFCYGKFIVDIYIRNKNLIIECNGNYWHNLPHRIKRDVSLQRYCDKWGIKLIWLWEDEIKENPKAILLKALENKEESWDGQKFLT